MGWMRDRVYDLNEYLNPLPVRPEPDEPRMRGWRSAAPATMTATVAAPGETDFMLPPSFEQPTGPQPVVPRRPSAADAYRMGQLAGMEDYREADAPAVYGAYDKAKREEERRARILATPMPGQTVRPPMIERTPESLERDRAMMELGRDMLVPQTPLDVGLMVAGGPVGGKLARGGAAALGALFEPDQAEAGVIGRAGKVLGGKPGGPHPGGIHVYHSSPHDFDRFDWSKLRTGEGANVYGSGFYFAENPAVSGRGGEYWKAFAHRFGGPEGQAAQRLAEAGFDRERVLKSIANDLERARAEPVNKMYGDVARQSHIDMLLAQQKALESGAPVGPRTYEVNINARPELMLDWDKPISTQSPHVRSVMEALRVPDKPHVKGEQAYFHLGGEALDTGKVKHGVQAHQYASEALREAGIPGIRYLDQGSRGGRGGYSKDQLEAQLDTLQADLSFAEAKGVGKPERLREQIASLQNQISRMPAPSYNYVVTDPSKLDILAKYGVVGGAPLGALVAQDRYQQ